MPKTKTNLCVDSLRHAEYYGMMPIFDELYANSKEGEKFKELMSLILSRNNILLAYRNIKSNKGSYTAGTDKLDITAIGSLSPETVVEKVRYFLVGSKHGYRPKPVRRKDIPKPNGKTRPLGIPCIWDRLIQQCIKQILEPICEAKFSNNSYGFRPNRSVEHAISKTYSLLQRSNMHYILEFDIKSFFDNVNHSKLIKQIWNMGIEDTTLLYIIRRILRAPIRMPNGETIYPDKGTPQGGIISPLLANIVLNELDHWIDSQWLDNPIVADRGKYRFVRNKAVFDRSNAYAAMRRTQLKEMYIVRYADDFRIFCRNRETAEKTMLAVVRWITERLKLEVSPEKTRIVNVRKRYSEFLGFKIRVVKKGDRYIVNSHICDKKKISEKKKLVKQAKNIANPRNGRSQYDEIALYDEMVVGIQNYYQIATCISLDCRDIHRAVMTVLTNRLNSDKGCRLVRDGGIMTSAEKKRYGTSKMIRYVSGIERPIYPIAYIKYKTAIGKNPSICSYTSEGRENLHENLRLNMSIMAELRNQAELCHSLEYTDCRLSLYSAQKGKCAISGKNFECAEEIMCCLKIPESNGGTEQYSNLILVNTMYAIPIFSDNLQEVRTSIDVLRISKKQLDKINKLRLFAKRKIIG